MIELIFAIEQYNFLCKYIPEIKIYEKNVNVHDGKISLEMTEDDFDKFEMEYSFAIVRHGMDNQDTVNDIGMELYRIFDECIY